MKGLRDVEIFDSLLSSIRAGSPGSEYRVYRENPVGFCKDVLGEAFTDEVQALMKSVRDNPVTIARSANAVGKTHGAARVAVWFYKVFPNAQVYRVRSEVWSRSTLNCSREIG
jgi:hypothetical protein